MSRGARALVGIFAVSGTVHLARPAIYEPIMPTWVPRHREVILLSGVAELLLAVGLAVPATRRAAGWGSAALLTAVYPANLKMTVDAARRGDRIVLAASLARLPLQVPMVKAALDAARA